MHATSEIGLVRNLNKISLNSHFSLRNINRKIDAGIVVCFFSPLFLLIDKQRGIEYFTEEEVKFLNYEEIKEEAKLNVERKVR